MRHGPSLKSFNEILEPLKRSSFNQGQPGCQGFGQAIVYNLQTSVHYFIDPI